MARSYAKLGTVSERTMRTEHLLPEFLYTLKQCAEGNEHKVLMAECDAWLEKLNDDDDDEAQSLLDNDGDALVDELHDALGEYAPPYCYFGSHEGDGSLFGFWVDPDFQERMREDGVLEVDDTSKVPADYQGDVLHVNDHGNCTLFMADKGILKEIWSVV